LLAQTASMIPPFVAPPHTLKPLSKAEVGVLFGSFHADALLSRAQYLHLHDALLPKRVELQ